MKKWIVTWNRPEMKEWASRIPEGYKLVVIHKLKTGFLCVKAKLFMGDTGHPDFQSLEEKYNEKTIDAIKQIEDWKHRF